MGEHQQREIIVEDPLHVGDPDALDLVVLEPPDLEASRFGQALDDVAIRREFAPADRDGPPPGARVQRR